MPRIVPIDPTTATGETAAHLATVRRMFGATPNLFTTAAHSPAALGAMLGMFGSLGKAAVGSRTGELIAIAVAEANRCGYCLSAHTAIGGTIGLAPHALESARRAESPDAKTAALLELATAINRTRGHIDDATLARARAAGITDTEIVESVALVALNVFTNYLNIVAQTEIDFPKVALSAAA